MFYADSVQDTRSLFFSSWSKYRQNTPLLPLEQQIVNVIIEHPEYQSMLETSSNVSPYTTEQGEQNPFLHMGLHLALREQINTNRPFNIKSIYEQLLNKYLDQLVVEHLMMEPLIEALWNAQQHQRPPDEQHYLKQLRCLLA